MLDRRFYKFAKEAISISLAEALLLQADYQERIEQIRHRLIQNATVQAGETPNEDPETLLADLQATFSILEDLNKRINKTYTHTLLEDGLTLTDAIAWRDIIVLKRSVYQSLVDAASIQPTRHSKSEIKFISTLNVTSLYQQIDQLSREYRNLDSKIQQASWNTELMS